MDDEPTRHEDDSPDRPGPSAGGRDGYDYDYDRADGTAEPDGASTGIQSPDTGVTGARVREVPTDLRPAEPIPGAGGPRPRPPAPAAPGTPRGRRRRPLLIGGAIAGALVLVLLVGAGFLLVQRPWEDGTAGATASASPSAASAQAVSVGGVEVTVQDVERAVPFVGSGSGQVDPEGEFVTVIVQVDNGTDATVFWDADVMTLVDDAGGRHAQDAEATDAYDTDARASKTIPGGESATMAAVFDVPIGTTPSAADIVLSISETEETGSLPLTP